MNSRANVLIPFSLFVFLLHGQAQLWAPILGPSQAIDWTKSGVGGIPARSTNCAVLTSSAIAVKPSICRLVRIPFRDR